MMRFLAQISDSLATGAVVAGVFVGVKITESILSRRNGKAACPYAEGHNKILTSEDSTGLLRVYAPTDKLDRIAMAMDETSKELRKIAIKLDCVVDKLDRRANG